MEEKCLANVVDEQTTVLRCIRTLLSVVSEAIDHTPSLVSGDALWPIFLALDHSIETLEGAYNTAWSKSPPDKMHVPHIPRNASGRDWLAEIRAQAGLSQYIVAEKAGISQSYYASIETGERGKPLGVPVAKSIASVLGFDWTRFYEEEAT